MSREPDWQLNGHAIYAGDCLESLRGLDAGSVRCCVTSPPYWGLRDYGAEGQLGLEPTPDEYVANMVAVFREVRRVLADDGTLWLNLGDSFLPNKQLAGIPWRVAFALQADGWYLRQDIIWHKPNPMPESVTDRCTKGHEYIFLLSKGPRYYYDAVAIAEPVSEATVARLCQPTIDEQAGSHRAHAGGKTNGTMKAVGGTDTRNKRSVWTVGTQPYPEAHFATYPPKLIEPCILAGSSERGKCPECGAAWVREVEREQHIDPRPMTTGAAKKAALGKLAATTPQGRRCGTATVTTIGWSPTCTCNREGWYRCDECDVTAHITSLVSGCPTCGETMTPAPFDPVPDTVLDPFTGSGTTGAVAAKWGRRFVGCELNPEYIQLAAKRIGVEADHLFAV